MPTETVYGLAADATNGEAVARIYAAKGRPSFNPLILHVATTSLDGLDRDGIIDLSALQPAGRHAAECLVAAAWPGPLTLVLPRGFAVPDLTCAGLDTVGVRCPAHPVARALIERAGPVAAPSANRSGRISPTTADAVLDELGDRVALVLDGGACEVGLESTVVHVDVDGVVTLLRPGFWTADALSEVVGSPVRRASDKTPDAPRSPGMTSRHYAPSTPFFALPAPLADLPDPTVSDLRSRLAGGHAVLLCWDQTAVARAEAQGALIGDVTAVCIDPDGALSATARGLYRFLRELDARGADLLLAEPFPPATLGDHGLAHALRDRLSRATLPWPT